MPSAVNLNWQNGVTLSFSLPLKTESEKNNMQAFN